MKTFGRDWEEIQAAQQGKGMGRPVQHEDDIAKYRDADLKLLEKYGSLDVLKKMGFDGVVDRLERRRDVEKI